MTLAILFSLKSVELLENRLQPHSGATPLFSMRTESQVSSQSCRSVVVDDMIITARQRSWGGANVFSHVCPSFCSGTGGPMWLLPIMHCTSLYSSPNSVPWTWDLTVQGPLSTHANVIWWPKLETCSNVQTFSSQTPFWILGSFEWNKHRCTYVHLVEFILVDVVTLLYTWRMRYWMEFTLVYIQS